MIRDAPFTPVVRDAVACAANRIVDLESRRGEIGRTDRSALCAAAQPFQDFIDALLFGMAGLSAEEVAGLKGRYEAIKAVK